MNSVLKNSKLLFGFSFCFYSFPCFSTSMNSNFVLVSSRVQPSFVEYKSPKNHIQIEQVEVQQNLHKYDAKCEGVFSFYPSSNSVMPKIITKKDNMVFLYSGKNKLEPLGSFLPPESKDLSRMEDSVAEGKLLLGFINKAHEPVALIQDNEGVVYSVTRLSKQHYSIQSMGILASALHEG